MATATIYSFTIEGTVSKISDLAKYVDSAGVKLDDKLQYVIAVDPDVQGSFTHNGETTSVVKSFFSSLETGFLRGYSYNSDNSNTDATRNYWNDYRHPTDYFAGNANANLYINSSLEGLSQWTEGAKLGKVTELSFAEQGHLSSSIELENATITKVETHATPLPAGILLLGSGVGALALVRRRVKISD
jgi:hypothetical protein